MRKTFRLNAASPSMPIDIDFEAASIVVNNRTASAVFVRIGSPDTPTETNADIFIAPGQNESHPVSGYTFAVSFGNVAAISSAASVASGFFQTCIITLLSKEEKLPSYGSASFISLALSDLTHGFLNVSNPTATSPPFDLLPWGGAVFYLLPTAGSGQGTITVQATDDISVAVPTWRNVGLYSFWPNVPVVLVLPRVSRYLRIVMAATAIAGQPAIAGVYTVRASIAEIFQETYSAIGASITQAYNVPAGTAQDFYFSTAGLPAVSIGMNGSGGTVGKLFVYVSQVASPAGPWRLVVPRQLNMAPGQDGGSLYRAVGSLDQYMWISIREVTNVASLTGTLTMQIPPAPETAGILNLIYNALGDVTDDTINTRRNILQELKYQTDTPLANIVTNLGTIITNTGAAGSINSSLGTINGSLGTINNNIVLGNAKLTSIDTNIGTIVTNTGSGGAINTSLGTINTSLGTINTSLGTINTSIGLSNTKLTSIDTNIGVISAGQTRGTVSGSNTLVTAAVGAWQNAGVVFTAGWYVTQVLVSALFPAAAANSQVSLAFGSGAIAISPFYTSYLTTGVMAGGVLTGSSGGFDFSSNRMGGIIVPVGQPNLWMQSAGPIGTSITVQFATAP